MDLQNVCRVCLTMTTESTDLFCENEKSLEILRKITDCFRIILNPKEYLPRVICKACTNELDIANNFRIKCETINERFQDYNNASKSKAKALGPTSIHDLEDTDNYCQENIPESPMTNNNEADSYSKCKICDKVLKSVKSLEKHIIRMHEKRKHSGRVTGFGNTRRYHCTTCTYETPHSQTLVNHMRRHNGDRPFNCECGKTFTQASSLAAHRKTHTDTSNFTCSECGKQFKHAFSLKTHLQVHNIGTYRCTVCLKLLKSKDSLHAHMKRHYKVYDYNCEDCGNTFVTSAELHNHRLKHSSEKAVVCHICNFTTKTRKSLLAHLKRHEGDKAYKCNFCIKSFFTTGDLRRHLRVHTREKPFSCHMCSQKFTYSTSLNKHMLNVHRVQFKWADVKWKDSRIKNIPLKSV